MGVGEPYGLPGLKPELAVYKASTLAALLLLYYLSSHVICFLNCSPKSKRLSFLTDFSILY